MLIHFIYIYIGQAIIDARGDVEQALEDLLLYYQAYETALELSHADPNVYLPHEKPPRRDGAVAVSQAPPPLKQQQQQQHQKKTQEELDMELAMKLQAEFDQEEALLRRSGGGGGGGMRHQRQSTNASSRAPGFGLDFTFLTDEQRAVLVNAAKQAILPLMEGVLGNIAIPPFNQAIGKYILSLKDIICILTNKRINIFILKKILVLEE